MHDDGGGNHLGVDLTPGPNGTRGQFINFGRDETHHHVYAASACEYLAALLDRAERLGVELDLSGLRRLRELVVSGSAGSLTGLAALPGLTRLELDMLSFPLAKALREIRPDLAYNGIVGEMTDAETDEWRSWNR
jgi:hypothetical protein